MYRVTSRTPKLTQRCVGYTSVTLNLLHLVAATFKSCLQLCNNSSIFLQLCIILLKMNKEWRECWFEGVRFFWQNCPRTLMLSFAVFDFCRITRGNFANILEGVTYFPRTSLNPLRVKPLFLEALSLLSPWRWRFSDVTWTHSARAPLGGSSACDSPQSLITFINPARFTIILCDLLVAYLHCTVRCSWHPTIRKPGHQRHWQAKGKARGGEGGAFAFVLCWLRLALPPPSRILE